MTKAALFASGQILSSAFCALNGIEAPAVKVADNKTWPFGSTCAYYRKHVTTIVLERCAGIGTAGMQWSFPGNTVDRTPYGVLQHELGHHVDWLKSKRRGPYFGDFSVEMRVRVGERPITSYCPNDAEWFAEMFRLFVTNPDLLAKLRPRTSAAMLEHFVPVWHDSWRERLAEAPERTLVSVERKINAA